MKDYNFAMLLRDLEHKVDGLKRIRISSIEASQVTDEVIQVLNDSTKIVRHLHMPLQSGSNTVLQRMRRKYSAEFYREKIDHIRRALPNLAITSDIIVGFPGETDEEFMETYNFVKDLGYAELHVFPYSQRTGTPAARMENQVDKDTKNDRVQQMIDLSNELARKYAEQFTNTVLEVIPEEFLPDKNYPEHLVGYTDNYLKVHFQGPESLIGEIVRIKITKPGYPLNEGTFVRVMEEATHAQMDLMT